MNPPEVPAATQQLSAEQAALVSQAQALCQVAPGGTARPLLDGRHLCLITHQQHSPDALLFLRAASGLGARVACLDPAAAGLLEAATADAAVRLLGRLYDGIECQGLPPPALALLREGAGVPVFDGVATAQHPSARLADLIGAAGDVSRQHVVQAVLLATLP